MRHRIKNLRTFYKLNQTDFGRKVEVSKSYIATIETGRQLPSMALVMKMLEQFPISADWLFRGSGEMFLDSGRELAAADERLIGILSFLRNTSERNIAFVCETINRISQKEAS